MNEHFYNAWVVACALIVYGIVFILLEKRNRRIERRSLARRGLPAEYAGKHASPFRIKTVDDIDVPTALKIGLFQCLAIIPGTSRSGSTIIGGMLFGCSRTAAAEFTFFLAIPIMFGWGLVKAVKFFAAGLAMTPVEIAVLIVGVITSFVVSIISIKFLMSYIKRNDFTAFGIYRIIVGIIVLGYFGLKAVGVL